MLKLFIALTEIGAVIAALLLVVAFVEPSAPRQAAGAALALCFVIIPYCVAATFQRRAILERLPAPPKKRAVDTDKLEPLDF